MTLVHQALLFFASFWIICRKWSEHGPTFYWESHFIVSWAHLTQNLSWFNRDKLRLSKKFSQVWHKKFFRANVLLFFIFHQMSIPYLVIRQVWAGFCCLATKWLSVWSHPRKWKRRQHRPHPQTMTHHLPHQLKKIIFGLLSCL